MHATLALAALASVASIAQAQKAFQPQSIGTLAAAAAAGLAGYGRFPCTQVNGDGTTQALQSLCTGLQTPPNPGYPSQGGNPAPTGNPQCVEEGTSGAYFCGIAGAPCSSAADCDNGVCGATGTCQGGFNQGCTADVDCLGFLYCSNANGEIIGTCGAVGDFCGDPVLTAPAGTDAATYNYLSGLSCATGFCALSTGNCGTFVTTVGGDCTNEPYICGNGLVPSTTVANEACVCQAAPVPSGRARARRNNVHRRNLCPASHTACSIEGSKGFECIDVSSNIEQCGACASAGGVDCSAIEGVSAVGCVAGVCEIWSCEDGYSFDADKAACVAL